METILITGTSGFIGFHLAKKLLNQGSVKIIGFDIENDYYDINLKLSRRKILEAHKDFIFYKGDLAREEDLRKVFHENKIDKVCHLAAQAGVRYSIKNPRVYIESNLVGFFNIIEFSREYKVKNFIYASSSSVYGKNEKQPFSIEDKIETPVSLYAATKKSNELIAHSYSHIYNIPTTGLRFFTVQGPYGRPDMAYFKFTKSIFEGKSIDVYNHGKMKRDFTDVEDIVDGIIKSLNTISKYEIFNLGNDTPIKLETLISLLEKNIGIKAKKNYIGMQDGDVKSTWSDIQHTKDVLGWSPSISVEDSISNFVKWYRKYYQV